MAPTTLEKLIWVLIYAGLFVLSVAYFVQPQSAWLGWLLIAVGGIAVVAGAVLIWVRSRMER